uniref:Uncharacterized protein n=1 Tax=Arundo donax TaxID=35708 RepID=A0A0A9CBZ6_ARUDO
MRKSGGKELQFKDIINQVIHGATPQ